MENKHWLIGGAIIVLLLGLIWWRSRANQDEVVVDDPAAQEAALESRVNQFLTDRNITLPEGARRVNLRSTGDENETGVVTVEEEEGGRTNVVVIAGLPELESGQYTARLVDQDEGDEKAADLPVGTLRMAKGGFLLEHSLNQDVSDYELFQVVRGEEVVLEGELSHE